MYPCCEANQGGVIGKTKYVVRPIAVNPRTQYTQARKRSRHQIQSATAIIGVTRK